MFNIDKKLQIIILLYLFILIYTHQKKPRLMFTTSGELKQFGTGINKTIVPLWLFSISICLLIYVYLVVRENDFI